MIVGTPATIVLGGAATLFVELALIRYVPGQMRVLGYFTNFVLLAAFLGFGVGMIAARRWPSLRWLSRLAPLALLTVVGITELGTTLRVLPTSEHFLFVEFREAGRELPLEVFLALSFFVLACCFAPLGHYVGRTLDGDGPLLRYGLNIAGSLLGIAVFFVLSAVASPPWSWMLLAACFTLVGVLDARSVWRAVSLVAVVAVVVLSWRATRDSTWSPYQKISTGTLRLDPKEGIVPEWQLRTLSEQQRRRIVELPKEEGFVIRVNEDSYQKPVDLSERAVAKHPALRATQIQYDTPFRVKKPAGSVLVLGAGAGNDVAAALRASATHVDAVEIDPEILRLGAAHPERPYSDARVEVHVDDARSFLLRTDRRYDTILFGLLDSHVLMSSRSTVRLDSFVFTKESFALARQRLAPGGVMFVSHAVGTPWFFDRMRSTLAAAFDKRPLVVSDHVFHPIGFIYASGDPVPEGKPLTVGSTLLEDDWPFVYLSRRTIPVDYLVAMAIMALIALLTVRGVSGKGNRGVDLHFFALGAGFLLLETRGLSVLAVLIGSTWAVTSAVFAGVLTMALLATSLGARLARTGNTMLPRSVYLALAATLVLSFVVPVGSFAGLPLPIAVLSATLLVSLPLFASGTVFALSLDRTGSADRALASNLLGAMAGGLLEYTSMLIGFRALVLVAAFFYVIALFTDVRARRPSTASAE